MAKVLIGTTMSLDGFMNDRHGSVESLYPDLNELRNNEMLQEEIQTTGAVIMGRRAYDMAQGDITGYEFQVPIFVLTHAAPARAAKGQNDKLKIIFITDGIESAVQKAKAAAGDKDITVVGGANTAQQLLNAGLVDGIRIGIMPILLGEGLRFFGQIVPEQIQLERTRIFQSPTRLDIWYRIVK
jgi:dihydrofolate reductase